MYATGCFVDASGGLIVRGLSSCDNTQISPCTQINYGQGLVAPGGGPFTDGFVGRDPVTTGVPTWLATLKGAGDDKIAAASVGPNASIYVAGWYNAGVGLNTTLTFGTATRSFVGAGDRHIVIAQLNPTTTTIGSATRTFASAGFEEALSMVWTGSEIVVAGDFASPALAFGTKVLASVGNFDIWVAKLSQTDATPVWAIQLGDIGRDVYP